MEQTNDISSELKSLGSNLDGLSKKMPFVLPDGYFGQLPDSLLISVGATETAHANWSREMPFEVPAMYFENLAEQITSAVVADGFGHNLPKEMPHQVPVGYFSELPGTILAKVSKPKKTIVFPSFPARVAASFRWAAAAVLVLGLGAGLFSYLHNRQGNGNPEQILASVNGTDIQDYLQNTYRIDVDKIVSNAHVAGIDDVDNKDIIQYLNETGWDATE